MDVSEICELIDSVVGRMDRETTGSTLLRCGDTEKHTDTGYAWDGVLFLAEALKREVMARGYGRMSEFRWHLMADEVPEYGECDYLVMGHKGGLQLAKGFAKRLWREDDEYFYCTKDNRGRKTINAKDVKAWAEIPPLEVDG